MSNYLRYFVLFTSLFLIVSCNEFDDFDGPIETNRELAIPLFHTTTSLVDLLDGFSEETFVTVGPDDLITLNYKGNVAERDADDFFSFLELVPIVLEDSVTSYEFALPGTLDVTYMKVKSGTLKFGFLNHLEEKVDVTWTIPQLTKNGEVFRRQRTLDSVGNAFGAIWSTELNDFPVDLTDFELQGQDDSLKIIYEAYRESDGERIEFNDDPLIFIEDLKFAYVEGFWGSEVLDLERDTIEIEFFETWVDGDVFFENPSIEITVNNSFGFPVRSQVNLMDIILVNGETDSLESVFITDGIDFAYPLLSEIGAVKTTVFDFDKTNSNIAEILAGGPVSVDYDVDAVSNPDNLPELGFMTDSSFFQVQLEVQLPFRGHINNFAVEDQFNVNFDSYDDVKNIEFKLVAENEIPLGIDMQIYFADENLNILDSLYTTNENILAAAPVDGNGEVTGVSGETTVFTTIDALKFDKVRNAKKLLVEGTFFTTGADAGNTQVVNLKADQNVNIRMGMKVGL